MFLFEKSSDISGPYGIPDGQVDANDLTALFGEWLSEADR